MQPLVILALWLSVHQQLNLCLSECLHDLLRFFEWTDTRVITSGSAAPISPIAGACVPMQIGVDAAGYTINACDLVASFLHLAYKLVKVVL
jgi:hypothetical protein